jgi:hypothetical protein
MWRDVLRPFRPGGPCIAATATHALGTDAEANAGTETAVNVPMESRALAPARSAGLPVVWS